MFRGKDNSREQVKASIPRRKSSIILQRVIGLLSSLAVIVIFILAILLAGVRLIGLTPYTVLSGSMMPKYKVGSLIYVSKQDPTTIQAGTVITFVLNADKLVATHRVISVDPVKELFYTKGDANDAPDGSPVHFKNVLGCPRFAIPYLGYLSSSLTTPVGMWLMVSLILGILILLLLPQKKMLPAKARKTRTLNPADGQDIVPGPRLKEGVRRELANRAIDRELQVGSAPNRRIEQQYGADRYSSRENRTFRQRSQGTEARSPNEAYYSREAQKRSEQELSRERQTQRQVQRHPVRSDDGSENQSKSENLRQDQYHKVAEHRRPAIRISPSQPMDSN